MLTSSRYEEMSKKQVGWFCVCVAGEEGGEGQTRIV